MSTQIPVKVALAQLNPMVGDLAGNSRRIVDAARRAHAQGARLVLTPELSLCGYPPEDLLLRSAFMQACAQALHEVAAQLADCEGLHVVVGHPHQFGEKGDLRSRSHAVPQRCNAASVLAGDASSPPTASASCRTTRCSTSGATSRRAATAGRVRWCSRSAA